MRFIESIKLKNGKIYHLSYHQKRVEKTFLTMFSNFNVLNLEHELQKIALPPIGLYKIRLEYDHTSYKIEIFPYQIKTIRTIQIIHCDTISYPFKSTNRAIFSELKNRSFADEIIIIKNGLVTDTSFSNLVFYKENQWFTPNSFLLNGTCRKRLLFERKIQQKPIKQTDIKYFEKIGIINAMIDLGEVQMVNPFISN